MPGADANTSAEATRPLRSPYAAQVLVCTDSWEDGCANKDSQEILTRFRRELRDRGLQLEVRVTGCECVGGCRFGPNVVIHPDGVWYQSVSPDDVPELIEGHLLGGEAVARLLRQDHHARQEGPLPITTPGPARQAAAAAQEAFPRTLQDGLKRTVTVPGRPEWVAAVSPGADDVLGELAEAERIASPARLEGTIAGGRLGVILADHDVPPKTIVVAEAAGVPLVALARAAGSYYYIQANIGLAARAIGAERRASALNAKIDSALERYRAAAEAAGRRRRAVYYTPAGTSLGPSSTVSNLISGAVGRNAVQRGPGDDTPVPLSIGEMAALDPDVILLGERETAPPGLREQLLADPRLAQTPAAREGRVHWLDLAPYADCMRSQRVLEPLAVVHRLLYPELAT